MRVRARALAILIAVGVPIAGTPLHAQRGGAVPLATIEYNAKSKPAATWSLGEQPLLTVSEDGTSGLYNLQHVMRLSESVVAIAGEASFTVVNRTGTVLRTIGRSGRGPGEFVGNLVESWHSGDTLRGMGGDSRVAMFSVDGVLLRTEQRVTLPGALGWTRVGYYANGALLIRSRQEPRTYPEAQRFVTTLGIWRQEADGSQRDLGRYPAASMVRNAGNRAVRLTFGGSGVVALWRDGFCTGSSTTYAFACYDGTGRMAFSVKNRSRLGRPVGAQDRALVYEVDAKANPGPEGAPQREATRRNTRFAERLPAFGRLLTSAAGDVWVGPAEASDATVALNRGPENAARWSVYDARGRWAADIQLPRGFLLTEVGDTWVAGIREDEDGLQQAVLLALRRQ
jgi:hypothetical protein